MVILAGRYWDESEPLDPELRPADCDGCSKSIAVRAGILVLDGPMMMLCPACYEARPGLARLARAVHAARLLAAILAGVVLALIAIYIIVRVTSAPPPRP